jgi:tRNA-binding protein
MASIEDFEKLEIRVGTVIAVNDFPEAKKPAYKLTIDFGEIGVKHSSAQFVKAHKKEEILGKQVACVVNFPPRKIGPFVSEVLTLGFADENGNWVFITPAKQVPNGAKLG